MRMNANEQVVGDRCILVPYCKHHVAKYHLWMQNAELLKQTSSEPLTLAEELAMQTSWRNDDDKLTFIILDKDTMQNPNRDNEIESMAGDVNVFVTPDDGNFELSVMIAEPKFRRGGLAYEAVQLMMAYVAQRLPPLNGRSFVAKIEADNKASIRLFEKLKFSPDSFSEVFNLFTYRLDVQFLENCNIETLTIEAYITDE